MTMPDKPDFSDVQSGFTTTEEVIGGEGGGGGTGEQTYTIEKGDTLSSISKRFYGKSKYWHTIFEANRDQIDNADKIFPGQTIKLPAIDIDGDGDLDDPTMG
jgi:nucleoid-associated protein YgaU